MISHIAQTRLKKVRVRSDVVERYEKDPRWKHQNGFARMSCNAILSQIAGMECQVVMASGCDHTIMWGVALKEKIMAPGNDGSTMVHEMVKFPSDYFEVLEMGFAEAN